MNSRNRSISALARHSAILACATAISSACPATSGDLTDVPSIPVSGSDGGGAEADSRVLSPVAPDKSDHPMTAEEIRARLLQLAFETASAIPMDPHVKDRCLSQQQVVEACLALDLPDVAREYQFKIRNWRRGVCVAKIAFYNARHGRLDRLEKDSELASSFAVGEEDWRRDQIRSIIAETLICVGRERDALRYELGLVAPDVGRPNIARAMVLKDEDYDALIDRLNAEILTGSFDQILNASQALIEVYRKIHADPARRADVEQRCRKAVENLTLQIQVEALTDLARAAADVGEADDCTRFLKDARQILDSATWDPDREIVLRANLAKVQGLAGDPQGAKTAIDALIPLYDAAREQIINIYRDGVLRPVAEAYQQIGQIDAARRVYARILEEGVVNPNSRPRAQDLSATCASMALCGFQPDQELWARIAAVQVGLSDPW